MAKKMDWFRLYPEIRRDPKIRRLDPTTRWLWITILCIASDSPERGRLLISKDLPYIVEDIADEAGMELEDIKVGLGKLHAINFIVQDNLGVYSINNWDVYRPDVPYDRPPAHEWRLLRQAVFERDDYTCQYCGKSGVKLECDHVIPVSRGGLHDMSNLVTSCFGCNRSKHNKTLEEWNINLL